MRFLWNGRSRPQDALVSYPPRDASLVHMFEQGQNVLARRPQHIARLGRRHRAMLSQVGQQPRQGILVALAQE